MPTIMLPPSDILREAREAVEMLDIHVYPESEDEDICETMTLHDGFLEYLQETYLHSQSLEAKYHPLNCLERQKQVTRQVRTDLVSWMCEVCRVLVFNQDTLHLAVNIVDRYFSNNPNMTCERLQLLGTAALRLAAKHEEEFSLDNDEWLEMCETEYTDEQLNVMEISILRSLQFRLYVPTSLLFLQHQIVTRFQQLSSNSTRVEVTRRSAAVARYLLQEALHSYSLCQFAPSLLARAALQVADELHHQYCLPLPPYVIHNHTVVDKCFTVVRSSTNVFSLPADVLEDIYNSFDDDD